MQCPTCNTRDEKNFLDDHEKSVDCEAQTCQKCGKAKDDVKERYSFGFYAGRYCVDCCSTYADNCVVIDGIPTTCHKLIQVSGRLFRGVSK